MPPELLKWADLPTIALVMLACQVLRPATERMAWIKAVPDRIIVLPLLLGTVFGVVVEATTPEFDWPMAIRRVLVDAFASAGMFRGIKVALLKPGGTE